MQYSSHGYIFEFNNIQGIINISNSEDEFVDCLELGVGTRIPQFEFEEKCNAWVRGEIK